MKKYQWKCLFISSVLFFAIALLSIKVFKKDDYPYQLSVIAIFQNEDRFLKEWLDFYRVMGVEHFYLFNNLSEDHYEKVLDPYIQAGVVELYDWPHASQPGSASDWFDIQAAAFRQGLDLAKGKSKWVALMDTDEFIFPKKKDNLIAFLKDYEECSGILVNWQLFGTSNINRIPDDQLMIETLLMQSTEDAPVNRNCKSIVRPETVKTCRRPNDVIHYPWTYSVDSDKKVFFWNFYESHPVNIKKIRINHYWSRDEEFFYTNKLARSENWGDKKQACMRLNEEANQIENREILTWVEKIRTIQ